MPAQTSGFAVTLNQAVSWLLDAAAARWDLAPPDLGAAALAGFAFALLVCGVAGLAAASVGARRHRAQRRRLKERLLGRGRLEPS